MAEARHHLLDSWDVLRRRRWVVYLAVTTVALVALVGSYLVTPLYRATVTLQIERETPDILAFEDLTRVDYSWAAYADFYQTQYKILSSETVARRAADRLDLVSHPLFQQEAAGQPGVLAWLRGLLPRRGENVLRTPLDVATAWLGAHLEVSPVRNSQLVRVSWTSPDPELAARVANAVADAYIAFTLEAHYSPPDQASEFLVNQIGALKQEIGELEERLQSYGEAKRIVSIDESSNITLRALADIAQRRTEAETRLAETEAAYRALRDAPPEALPEVRDSELINRLKAEHASYESQYGELAQRFKDDWPALRTLRSRLEQLQARIAAETEEIRLKVVAAAQARYLAARHEVEQLDTLQREHEAAAQRLKRDAFDYATLQAEVQRKREILNALLKRQNEMALATRLQDLDVTSSNVRVVDPARPPTAPYRPNVTLNLLLGLVLGLALGVGMAFFLDYLDNTVSSPSHVERETGLPTLAVIPRHVAGAAPLVRVRRRAAAAGPVDLVAQREGRAAATEAFRELRTAILLSSPGSPPRQLMVTSALAKEGKSATTANLALVFAQLGRRVLLVDADLRRPRLHRIFETDNERGLSTYLSGLEKDPRQLVRPTEVPGLDLLPSGPVPPNPADLLAAPVFADLGHRLLEAGYEHILYDSPPVLSVADPVLVAAAVERAILVVRADFTPRESLRAAVDKLVQAGVRPAGLVLNDLDLDSHARGRYGYGRYAYTRADRGEAEPVARAAHPPR